MQRTTTRRTRRMLRAGAAAFPLAAAIAAPAAATPPITLPPPGTYTLVEPVSPCGAVAISVDDQSVARLHLDKYGEFTFATVTGTITASVESLVSGRSIDLNISGPAKFNADGSAESMGPTLIFGPTVLQYVRGRTVWSQVGDINPARQNGKVIDLCSILNP